MLKNTLRSLTASRLGRSKIRLLLNGCTDGSRQRVLAATAAFKDINFKLIEVPVDLGVAPARNWLFSLSEVQKAEYVVFADDDIRVQEDWLEILLSLAESVRVSVCSTTGWCIQWLAPPAVDCNILECALNS